jgi:hypothetical protein
MARRATAAMVHLNERSVSSMARDANGNARLTAATTTKGTN